MTRLARTIGLSVTVGVLAGLAAVVFYTLVEWSTSVGLGLLVDHHPANVAGDGPVREATAIGRPWALPLVVGAGAVIAAWVGGRVSSGTAGHGTDVLIDTAHTAPARMRLRTTARKLLAAAILIGSGGSGGTEGPMAQAGGALGSTVGRLRRTPDDRTRQLVLVGAGAAIGAIFRAPLGGAVIGGELLYRRGVVPSVIAPALVASTVAFGLFGAVHGFTPVFGDQSAVASWQPGHLVVFAALGAGCGLVGRFYIGCLYGVLGMSRRAVAMWSGPRRRGGGLLIPALAGTLVGCLGLVFPGVLGTGYGTAQLALDRDAVLGLAWWMILLLPLAKIAATSLSIGSGGAGGVFGPGLVIGATVGCAAWRIADAAGLAVPGPAAFAIVGMAAFLGPIIHAPIGVTVLVIEATRCPELVIPALLAVGVATLVVGDHSLYRSQRPRVPRQPRERHSDPRSELPA